MMTLWCMARSPLMIGSELTKMDDFTLSLLTNAELLAIGKESFCGHPLYTREDAAAWIAPRQDGRGLYAALFNLSDKPKVLSLTAKELSYDQFSAFELWTGARVEGDQLSIVLDPHDSSVWRIR